MAQSPRRKLPRGATSLPREVVEAEQRKRLVAATARVVGEKGYADATVADIIAVAGISRATFYQLFRDKEACFLYGFLKLSQAHLREAKQEIRRELPLPEQLRAALTAYLRRVDADLWLARAYIAEAESATPASRAAYAASQRRLRKQTERWLDAVRSRYPGVPRPSETDWSLLMAGLNGLVVARVRSGRPFTGQDVTSIFRYVLACLGLYGWAAHAARLPAGNPGEPT